MAKFYIWKDLSAFDEKTIGSKVVAKSAFLEALDLAVHKHDTSKDDAPGQHVIHMDESAFKYVSAGDGEKTDDPDDYVIRKYREGPKMFLKREKAGKIKSLTVVVYTKEAYLADPDCTDEEREAVGDCTHAIVAIKASAADSSPVSPFRFVHNLAGGNNSYKMPPPATDNGLEWEDEYDAMVRWGNWVVEKAKESLEHSNTYIGVAD